MTCKSRPSKSSKPNPKSPQLFFLTIFSKNSQNKKPFIMATTPKRNSNFGEILHPKKKLLGALKKLAVVHSITKFWPKFKFW
jgi:hypothetical protein